jgi:hypothetical protein
MAARPPSRLILASLYGLLLLFLVPSLLNPGSIDRLGTDCEPYGWPDRLTAIARATLASGALAATVLLARPGPRPALWLWVGVVEGSVAASTPWLFGQDGCVF